METSSTRDSSTRSSATGVSVWISSCVVSGTLPPEVFWVTERTPPTLVTPRATGKSAVAPVAEPSPVDAQEAPGGGPAGAPMLEEHHPTWRSPVVAVAVLVVFFALLTLADVLPGQSGAPGLVAPPR